jgi:predicted component of type VI protein secretion system
MPLNVKLIVVGGDVKTEKIRLRLPSTIGRGRGASIVLAHPLVSRQHCELFEADGKLMVRDLGSLNGTFINNQRITEAPLPPGELLTIGTVTFRAVYESQPGVHASEASAPQRKSAPRPAAAGSPTPRASVPTPKSAPPSKDEGVEFNFDRPLMPVEDEAAPGTAAHPTRRLETTVADTVAGKSPDKKAAPSATAKPGQPAAKTAPTSAKPAATKPVDPAKSPPAKSAPGKSEDATVDFKEWEATEDDDEKVESATDDDLNDFLKSLGE